MCRKYTTYKTFIPFVLNLIILWAGLIVEIRHYPKTLNNPRKEVYNILKGYRRYRLVVFELLILLRSNNRVVRTPVLRLKTR